MRPRPFPGPSGREHLRVMQRAAHDPNGAVAELYARYGRAFAFGFGPVRSHWLIGAEANAFVLAERRNDFRQRGAYLFLEPIGGRDALISSDEPEHRRRRRTVQKAFHHRQVAEWTEAMAARFERFFGAAAAGGVIDAHAGVRREVLALMIDLLLGDTAPQERRAWRGDIAAMMDFANRPLLAQQFRLPLPGTPWRAFAAARRRTDRRLYAEIARRRAGRGGETDVLGLLLASSEDGDRSLRDQTISLISAAFDTTSSALAWTLYLLAERPQLSDELRGEIGAQPLAGALSSELLGRVLAESLRLYPAASAGLRRAVRPLEFDGYTLPAGALVAFSIYLTHRDAATFPAPDRFDPDRWLGATVSPFAYLPFGYGARHCIGAALAQTAIKVALVVLLRSYRAIPAWQGSIQAHGTTLQPSGGLPLRIVPRAAVGS